MKKIYLLTLSLLFAFALQAQVVINEVYGGGGNSGATYKNDFIELYNNGTTAVSLTGWSVQYASAAGTTWGTTVLSGSIQPGGYYLIQEAVGLGGSVSLPTPDASGSLNLSGTNGKVALVNSSTALAGATPAGSEIQDFVGFGSAGFFEGTAAPAPSNTTSISRTPTGSDTQDNGVDFTAGAPSPTNGAGPDVTAPTVTTLSPANSSANIGTSFLATINFDENVLKGATGSILLKLTSDNSVVQTIDITTGSVTISGGEVSFAISGLTVSTAYYFEISSASFKDAAGNAFAGFTGNSTWSFTTGTSAATGGTIGTTYNFNTCTSAITDGFTQYSVTGPQVWACTTFGRDPAAPAGTAAFPNAVQINGFNVTNILNEDWFISPAFDLTATAFPLLSFWSRTTFNGPPLLLKVSTNYTGTGDPSLATWTTVDGRFPSQTSNTWKLSQNVNLAAFKSAGTYFAFVYNSSADDGARWTLDDITVTNSTVAPPASLTTSTGDLPFGFVASTTAAVKTFSFTGNDVTAPVTLTTIGAFLISKTNGNFASSISYTQAEANNTTQTVYVQFTPTGPSQNFTGTTTISTTGVGNALVNLSGNSIDAATTLEVVNWNLEWFGSTTLGPTNDVQQEANVKTITQNIGADVFALAEVVSETRLQNVVANLNTVYGAGTYAYVISNYGSHTNPFESGAGPLAEAQKEAFVYKTAVVSPIGTPSALVTNGVNTAADLTNPAYNYFSSGRYPYMMNANVTLGGITKQVRFVLIHAKANTSPTATSYARRKAGSDTLNQTLKTLYPNDNIMLLGDFNDDLDQSITAGFTVTSYSAFTTDPANFFSPTVALSLARKKSTVSYNDMIDHVEVSNELQPFYMGNSAAVLTDVTSLVTNYGSTTTDHYPVFTRYAFDPLILPVSLLSFTATKQSSSSVNVTWSTAQEVNSNNFVIERSADNRTFTAIATVTAAGNSSVVKNYVYTDNAPVKGINYYRLKQVDIDNKFIRSITKTVLFSADYLIKIAPNPATDNITIYISQTTARINQIIISDATGKVMERLSTKDQAIRINTNRYAKGTYYIKVINDENVSTQKIIVQ